MSKRELLALKRIERRLAKIWNTRIKNTRYAEEYHIGFVNGAQYARLLIRDILKDE